MSKCHIVGNHVLQLILMCPYLAGVHARNQEFYSGGGGGWGGPGLTAGKHSGQRFFFFFFFFFFL